MTDPSDPRNPSDAGGPAPGVTPGAVPGPSGTRDVQGAWEDQGPWAEPDPGPDPGTDSGTWADDGEWEDYRAPMSRGRRLLVVLGVLGAVVFAVGFFAWSWVSERIDPPGPPGEEVPVEIASGSTTSDIGEQLAEAGVIRDATVWGYWTRIEGVGPFQAGEYTFAANMSYEEAVTVLEAGPRPPELDRVTIPEGLTVTEIVARLADPERGLARWDAAALQAAVDAPEIRSAFQPADQASMEGLLFPDTYEVDEDTDERAFVSRLVAELDERLRALDVEARAAALGRTPYEIVIIASLIEEEARVASERPMISRVIHNRLEQGIPLGIDATSRYEAEIAGRSRDDIDFSSDSPYNTRRVQGLPPTPIAAPGQASLEAALAPADGPWIFYVLQDEQGNHFFTDSSAEFQRAKQECIRKDLGCG